MKCSSSRNLKCLKILTEFTIEEIIWVCIFACIVNNIVVVVFTLRRQRGRMVNASDSLSGGPEFESHSGDLLDLLSVIQSSNPQPHL